MKHVSEITKVQDLRTWRGTVSQPGTADAKIDLLNAMWSDFWVFVNQKKTEIS